MVVIDFPWESLQINFFVVHLIRIPTCLGTRRWFCFHTRCFVYFGGLSCNHPTSGSLLDRAVVTPAWARIYSSGSPETCRIITDAICRNSKNRIRLKLCRPFLGSFKARAPLVKFTDNAFLCISKPNCPNQ